MLKYSLVERVNLKDLIAPSAITTQPTYIRLGSQFVRTIFVITYPRYIAVGWFAPIINLNYTLDISMFFYPVEPGIILKQLKNITTFQIHQEKSSHNGIKIYESIKKII